MFDALIDWVLVGWLTKLRGKSSLAYWFVISVLLAIVIAILVLGVAAVLNGT